MTSTTIPLHPSTASGRDNKVNASQTSPLPQLLHTPSGLALLELQGTINLPGHDEEEYGMFEGNSNEYAQQTAVGRLVFPSYNPELQDPSSTAWMKRVYLYVGKHQRLTGEVKKLLKAIAIIRKRTRADDHSGTEPEGQNEQEELEVVEIVKWKILFSQRPEPVGTWDGSV
jgi:chromosome transmission fidelity protein 8